MVRLIIGVILGAIVIIFAIQNTEVVTYRFLAGAVSAPRSLVVAVVFLVGLLTGWLVTGLRRRVRHTSKKSD